MGEVFGHHVRGALAWLAWLCVHIFFLIGFRNRVLVILEWSWQYLTFRRGARLTTDTAEQWQFVAADRAAAGSSDGSGRLASPSDQVPTTALPTNRPPPTTELAPRPSPPKGATSDAR